MPLFEYKAVAPTGETVRGTMEAGSETAVIAKLQEGGNIPLSAFEAGKGGVGRGGVVRDPEIHREVLRRLFATAGSLGLGVVGLTASPLRGPAGNIEFPAHLVPGAVSIAAEPAIEQALGEAPAG